MAFLPEDPNTQNQNQAPAGQNGSMASQAPITSSPAPAGGGTSGKTINQASSSAPAQPFTNLQTYLTANAPQIQQQGQQIAGTLNDQYGATTGAIDQAKNTFNSQVDSGYTHNDPQVVNKFTADPSAVAADPNAAKQFTGMYNDQYTGPASFESSAPYGAVNDQVNKGVSLANQVSSPGGVQSYLMGQNPNETNGMATLDSSLIGANPDAVSAVTNAAGQYKNLPSYLTDAVTSADSGVTAAQQQAQAARGAATTAAANAGKGLTDTVNSELASATGSAKAYNQSVNDYLSRIQAVSQAERALPDIMSQYNATWNGGLATPTPSDPSSYPTASTIPLPTMGQVATPHDFATQAALQALTGGQASTPLGGVSPGAPFSVPTLDTGNSGTDYLSFLRFINSNANNNMAAPQQNVAPAVSALNQWYLGLLKAGGTAYSGTPAPFTIGTSGPGRTPGLV